MSKVNNTYEILKSLWRSGDTSSIYTLPNNTYEYFKSVYDEELDALRVTVDNLNQIIQDIADKRIKDYINSQITFVDNPWGTSIKMKPQERVVGFVFYKWSNNKISFSQIIRKQIWSNNNYCWIYTYTLNGLHLEDNNIHSDNYLYHQLITTFNITIKPFNVFRLETPITYEESLNYFGVK